MQQTFPGWHQALIEASVETLRMYEPKDAPYYGCFSGGKDSVVIKEVARLAGVAIDWHYNVTTIDPPELVYFIRDKHPDVTFNRPPGNFFSLILKRGFPTRRRRWCCETFKESKSPKGARLVMGIRAAESPRRAANWQTLTPIHGTSRSGGSATDGRPKEYAVLPILHWHDDDVWAFIRERELPYCSLYDEGWKRLGCIGCPMSGPKGRARDFARWPRYEMLWRRAFKRLWEKRANTKQRDGREWFGSARFDNWEAMWDWWNGDGPLPAEECQGGLELWG